MKRSALLFVWVLLAPSVAFADASKDAVAGAVVHGEMKLPREEKRPSTVKDEPTASKTAPLLWLPVSKKR